jgi:sterol desaturase/sphingolipid hydroxylase (fatty acid hydroxylase superfamily)
MLPPSSPAPALSSAPSDVQTASPAAISLRREEQVAQVPRWYRGEVHFVLLNLLGGAILYLVARGLPLALALAPGPLTWRTWVTVPLAFVFANYFEWRIHRGPLHRPGWPRILYKRHTLLHHAWFHTETMAVCSHREMKFVLFPLPALFGAALVALPPALLCGWLVGAEAGRVFYLVAISYYLLYEWLHLAYHLPAHTWLGRNPLIRWMRQHHARHHDPKLMVHRNFNVTFPLWDALLGTLDRAPR